MAVPKKRTSASRRNMRRSHHALAIPTHIDACPDCGEVKLRHHVCPACGRYRERQVFEPTSED